MTGGIGNPIGDYQTAIASQTQLMAQFQKTPSYQQDVAYYQANIAKVKSVSDLLGNYKLLTIALSAFGVQDQINNTGILKKVLSQDPNIQGNLVQRLGNPGLVAFAQAYWSLSYDHGAGVQTPSNINAVLAGYQTTQYQQWVASTEGDPTVQQALSFQSTVQDTIDLSNAASLYAQYQQNPAVQQSVQYYKANIGNVTSVATLMADPKLLDMTLSAYGIDPTQISSTTVQQLLTQSPTASGSAAQDSTAYMNYAKAFASLNTDGGAGIQSASSVAAVVSGYEVNQFSQALATNSGTANQLTFGAAKAGEIKTLLADFQQTSGVQISLAYYKANIGKVTNVADLVNNPQLLSVALTAYGLDPTQVSASTAQTLLTQNPTAAGSLAQQNPTYLPFAEAFASLNTDGGAGIQSTKSVAAVTSAFQTTRFEGWITAKLQQALTDQASFTHNRSTGKTAGTGDNNPYLSMYQVLSDPTLKTVVQTALGLPPSTGGLAVSQQIAAMTNAGFTTKQLQDPAGMSSLINRFLANTALNQSAPPGPTGLLSLFGSGSGSSNNGIVPINLSSLIGGSGSTGGSGTGSGGIVNLFA